MAAFITGGLDRLACEIGSLTGSCPNGAVCVDRPVSCPVGALCTVTTNATWFDADQRINWTMEARATEGGGFASPDAIGGFPNYITSPPTPKTDTVCSTGLDGDRCFTRATVQVIGDGRALFSGCAANVNPYIGPTFGPNFTLGDDDVRHFICEADWKIGPADPLATVPVGTTTIQVNAPAAGQLTLGAGKLHVANPAAASAHQTPRIAPAHITAKHAGAVTITLKLNGAATRLLHHARHLRVTLQLTFTPTGGTTVRTTRKITITAPAPRHKVCKLPHPERRRKHLPSCLTHP
jgi:hypothetical protein